MKVIERRGAALPAIANALKRKLHVLSRREPGKESSFLEYHGPVRPCPCYRAVVFKDLTSAWRNQTRNEIQKSALAAARWTDEAGKLAWLYRKGYVADRRVNPAARLEGNAYVLEADLGRRLVGRRLNWRIQPLRTAKRNPGRGRGCGRGDCHLRLCVKASASRSIPWRLPVV